MYCHIHHCHYHHCNCVPTDSKEKGGALTQAELLALTQEMKQELKDYTVDLKDQISSYIDVGLNPVEIANSINSLKEQDTYVLKTLTKKIDELNNTTNLGMFNLRTRVTDLEGQSATIISDLADRTQRIVELEINTQVVESVADLSTIKNPKDGLRVYVKSYHAGLNKGGGYFTYDSSKTHIDDNGTSINGWVRQVDNHTISTDDFGLKGDGTDTDATVRLQNFLLSAKDGYKLIIKGSYTVNKNLAIYGVKDVEVVGINSKILADKENWEWSNGHITDLQGNGINLIMVMRGVVLASNCPNIKFKGIGVKGHGMFSQVAGTNPFQDGDCGIQAYNCDNAVVEYCSTENTVAWGILLEKCHDPVVRHNSIKDIYRQSGINCVVGTTRLTSPQVYGNKIYNAALYGVEFETYTSVMHIQCYANNINNCYTGVTVTCKDNEVSGLITNNNITEVKEGGVWVVRSYNENNNLLITNNNISSSYRGITLTLENKGITVANNVVNGAFSKPTYIKYSPDSFVIKVKSPNTFLIAKKSIVDNKLEAGKICYIDYNNLTKLNVVSVTDTTEKMENTTAVDLVLVEVQESVLTNDFVGKSLYGKYDLGDYTESAFAYGGDMDNVNILNNTASNCKIGLLKELGNTSIGRKARVFNNILTDCKFASIFHNIETFGVEYKGNIISGTPPNINSKTIENGSFDLKEVVKVSLGPKESTATPALSTTLSLFKSELISAVFVTFKNSTTTGNMVLKLDGDDYSIGTDSSQSKFITLSRKLNSGEHTVKLVDTVGDWIYDEISITFLSLN